MGTFQCCSPHLISICTPAPAYINQGLPGPADRRKQISMDDKSEIIEMTADIVSAYVGNNSVAAGDLASLIQSVHRALSGVTGAPEPVEVAPKEPAVPIKRSIQPDHLVCLEDGRKFKSLKRHLRTKYNMSPEDYRAKWPRRAPSWPSRWVWARAAVRRPASAARSDPATDRPAPRGVGRLSLTFRSGGDADPGEAQRTHLHALLPNLRLRHDFRLPVIRWLSDSESS